MKLWRHHFQNRYLPSLQDWLVNQGTWTTSVGINTMTRWKIISRAYGIRKETSILRIFDSSRASVLNIYLQEHVWHAAAHPDVFRATFFYPSKLPCEGYPDTEAKIGFYTIVNACTVWANFRFWLNMTEWRDTWNHGVYRIFQLEIFERQIITYIMNGR